MVALAPIVMPNPFDLSVDTAPLDQLNAEFESASASDILRWAHQTFGEQLTIVTSFQPTGIATLHLMRQIAPRTTVLTLDTGVLFRESLELMDVLEDRLQLNLVRVRSHLTLEQQAHQFGDMLWERDPDMCCQIRKVAPLDDALMPFTAWVAGLRRDQGGRAQTPIVAWDSKYNKVKLCPLAKWSAAQVWAYLHEHDLPYNPLHDRGYRSIGCDTPTCTRPVRDGEDDRAGRWVLHEKNECGIHFSA